MVRKILRLVRPKEPSSPRPISPYSDLTVDDLVANGFTPEEIRSTLRTIRRRVNAGTISVLRPDGMREVLGTFDGEMERPTPAHGDVVSDPGLAHTHEMIHADHQEDSADHEPPVDWYSVHEADRGRFQRARNSTFTSL